MVKWAGHSVVQLRHIHDYIAQDSPLYAKRVSDALVRKTFLLDELPRLGLCSPLLVMHFKFAVVANKALNQRRRFLGCAGGKGPWLGLCAAHQLYIRGENARKM